MNSVTSVISTLFVSIKKDPCSATGLSATAQQRNAILFRLKFEKWEQNFYQRSVDLEISNRKYMKVVSKKRPCLATGLSATAQRRNAM